MQCSLPRSITCHLDSVRHASARIISGRHKYDHITAVLRDELHWLPVPQRKTYKLCLTAYKAINCSTLAYLAEMCVPISANQARLRLRSSDSDHLLLSRMKTEFGKQAFAYAGPHAWNDLPTSLRSVTTLCGFNSALKTHLFGCAYSPN